MGSITSDSMKFLQSAVLTFCSLCLVVVPGLDSLGSGSASHSGTCSALGIAVYNVTFQTFWSKESFPKQYPMYRPHAQWGRLIGRTHSTQYSMWREHDIASAAVKLYAETGDTVLLDTDMQGYRGVYDVFSGTKINSGVGQTAFNVFADAEHSMVSLISRIIPSPDWFVGLDSLPLCDRGTWLREKQLDLKIWDAGTDKGFTFTAPNWAEVPQVPISEINASYPNNMANGFYYVELERLPTIARVTISLASQTMQVQGSSSSAPASGHIVSNEQPLEDIQPQLSLETDSSLVGARTHPKDIYSRPTPPSNNLNDQTTAPRQAITRTKPSFTFRNQFFAPPSVVKPPTSTDGAAVTSPPETTHEVNRMSYDDPRMSSASTSRAANRRSIKDNSVGSGVRGRKPNAKLSKEERQRLRRERNANKRKKNKNKAKNNKRKTSIEPAATTPPSTLMGRVQDDVDCQISPWGEWSSCSKTCGFGRRSRTREVLEISRGRGKKCPILFQEEVCGSMRGCGWKHFSSNNWGFSGI